MASISVLSCALERPSTADIEPALRFEAWRERAHRYVEMEPLAPHAPFQADLLVLRAPDYSFGTMHSSAYGARALPQRYPDAANMMVLSLILSGNVRMTADTGERRRIERGSLGVELARQGMEQGNSSFGSLLLGADGKVLFEGHNDTIQGDATRHPEIEIARWASQHLGPQERRSATVYTSGEHCPMCAAAHGWAASSTPARRSS